eukprot:CAMPEP_0175905870 /NCGR_PEP_ID=MMETSP0108-20121206/5245_1 /TAXON_ID=195067 ORGANISM="Goniomonas pacifica, Strain CCMP1869" /NCGR_SAMPLE_ID=MMETSP0108 /ASSEMBLY_ACC=CAM_ASM_000204 /LENGTH=185 /DNA_ID=CAMNT_0017227787 /DNA_START=748 /DNA_END=1306 /DNA_ORIENTATION=+
MNANISVVQESATLDKYLSPYKELIGKDYEGYRNHNLRVLTYAMHTLKGEHERVVATALVFHDIALWTDSVLNYIDPSWDRAREKVSGDFTETELETIKNIIIYHHKITEFTGPNAAIVNAVREGDWVDASQGVIKKSHSPANIAKVTAAIPNAGFHDTLAGFGPKLHGWNIPKIIYELGQIYYW